MKRSKEALLCPSCKNLVAGKYDIVYLGRNGHCWFCDKKALPDCDKAHKMMWKDRARGIINLA